MKNILSRYLIVVFCFAVGISLLMRSCIPEAEMGARKLKKNKSAFLQMSNHILRTTERNCAYAKSWNELQGLGYNYVYDSTVAEFMATYDIDRISVSFDRSQCHDDKNRFFNIQFGRSSGVVLINSNCPTNVEDFENTRLAVKPIAPQWAVEEEKRGI